MSIRTWVKARLKEAKKEFREWGIPGWAMKCELDVDLDLSSPLDKAYFNEGVIYIAPWWAALERIRNNYEDMRALLRHELGHCIVYHSDEVAEAFDLPDYPEGLELTKQRAAYQLGLISYGEINAEEDYCEKMAWPEENRKVILKTARVLRRER